jgi:hypothetical protein
MGLPLAMEQEVSPYNVVNLQLQALELVVV